MIQRDEDGKESGIGFVEFTNKDQAERALERDRKSMGHRWEGYGVWGYMSNRSALCVFSFAHNNNYSCSDAPYRYCHTVFGRQLDIILSHVVP